MIGLFLCGDVMTGRGIDQILPHPGNPTLHEPYVRDAREYVRLAEQVNGPISRPVNFEYIWGDALPELRQFGPDVRIINLETSVTSSDDIWPDKEVLYRMHPRNIGCITAAGIDCCCLANNHVLDWGHNGLSETLQTLDMAGISHAGAGGNAAEAAAPAVFDVAGKSRVLVFALGSTSSGIPSEWDATEKQPGVCLLPDLSMETARTVANRIRQFKRNSDVAIASIHWGSNWGHVIPVEHIQFAHWLIDEGIDIVHGHSSHHVRAIEVYRNRLILYGCGDFLNDYEGIEPHGAFRGDLSLMYLLKVDPQLGRLVETRFVPMQIKHFRLNRASPADAKWLAELLNKQSKSFGTQARLADDGSISLQWR